MSMARVVSITLCALALLLHAGNATSVLDYAGCQAITKAWALKEMQKTSRHDKENPKELLFFLHIPRTGGRSFFHCLLRNLYPSEQECPRSYDKVRFDMRKPECRLISTHDDYSIVDEFPKNRTSVLTILRNPIDRIFSAYEFSVEVSARFLIHPNLSSAVRSRRKFHKKIRGVSTLDIWPWKYLVPWMREDLFARREARRLVGIGPPRMNKNPYNMTTMLMPFHEFIESPLAFELLHNGVTFQVTGLNNNSHIEESWKIRWCVARFSSLGSLLLQVAKKRLDDMLYVGLTENHKESATIFATLFGAKLMSGPKHLSNNSDFREIVGKNIRGTGENVQPESTLEDKKSGSAQIVQSEIKAKENFSIGKLIKSYEGCVSSSRSSQGKRRISSLQEIAPANFSGQARTYVPESVIKEIEKHNSLDLELYNYAKKIYYAQQRNWIQQKQILHRDLKSESQDNYKVLQSHISKRQESIFLWAFTIIVSAFALIYFVTARRRASKVKV